MPKLYIPFINYEHKIFNQYCTYEKMAKNPKYPVADWNEALVA